ncbi:uncharacterized protein BT62DRAFT_926393 [Guyanagaster necrorhizus]|uniref:1-phosphatidylinositol-3-phosphate 5-kinase n=1 Tax=Guyanagaster necrorhizus TaxID=856835 RepID=A0A9P8AXV2_9AGAR|nr:uncharacterized protein BT62DRAFT_926393 [Guyanagaster necrorhizus MCA 3950]KAG7452179.1 hypothetical protein BT62DRAFT_926393 [Guyanagaster necrorhizus MCA 3950]
MASSQVASPVLPASRTKLVDADVTSLTTFNPFSEEDENDQSSYTLVTSLFSKVKNSFSTPLSAVTATQTLTGNANGSIINTEPRRPSYTLNTQSSYSSRGSTNERLSPLAPNQSIPAPPLVSLTPAQSELLVHNAEYDRPPSRGMFYSPVYDSTDGGVFGTTIPGFPIQDDARSVKTSASLHRSGSVSKVIRRIRGEGLSRDYWMDDENCKECYDCKSVFTAWRRKHHCRICGQIFCSRCASNIIKGSRFGHDGMVRVCNLCLEKLAKVDDDDRRSVVSSVMSFPAHQVGETITLAHHPQSPFAASQLFGRTDEPFNLYSIAETKRRISGSDESAFGSRPITPQLRERDDGMWESPEETSAPFRRGLSDEESEHDVFESTGFPTFQSQTPIEFPTMPDAESLTSSIQFPMGSPEHGGQDSPWPVSRMRSRLNSLTASTPFIRSRVQSRLDSVGTGEPGWRARRESTAYAQELNLTSMHHLRIMLRQMLSSEQVPNMKEWEETLLKLALRIARDLTFTSLPHRQGQDMDVRRYVKIKKIPGGTPQDSEYVDGAVITKNVAHKHMLRSQRNPRVMLVTFPLEFSRIEGQYMHFGQIVRQEKEYLGNLATRIAALRPHVVLVEKSVSRLALEALARHNIAVARAVKPSAIQLVARMTQGDVFSSMDKLALEPRLGHCSRYRIQTYDHPLIPGRRKSYMRFEGCNHDMGCTIILRGDDISTLRRIKKVTRFLIFIVRNLKLETHLWKDSVITLPQLNTETVPSSPSTRLAPSNYSVASFLTFGSSTSTPRGATPTVGLSLPRTETMVEDKHPFEDDDLPDEDAEQLKLSRRIDKSLEPYTTTFISVSATLRFPPPFPIRRMKELDVELSAVKRAWEDEVIRLEEKREVKHEQESTLTSSSTLTAPIGNNEETEQDDIKAQIEALPTIPLTMTPSVLTPMSPSKDQDGYFPNVSTFASAAANLVEEPMEALKTPTDIALESQYSLVKCKHEEHRRIWEWYLRKNYDDFVVEKYQCIRLLEYIVPIADFGFHRACFAPKFSYVTFYGENDCTLGQYVEESVTETLVQFLDPKAICTGKGCDQPLARHCKVFVHNETKVFVAVEQWDGQIIGRSNFSPAPELITTWSACRICGAATPFIPVSEEMQRYSFAKFLELHFYPTDVKLVQGAGCQHNIYQHHVRYFACKGMTVRFQADPVTLHEVVYPPFRIRVRPETQLEIKNSDFNRLHHRNLFWYTGLIDDLKLISIDAATGDEDGDAKLLADINMLIARAETERGDISRLINHVYRESAPTDTLALNQVRSYRQDKIVAWQQDFDRLPKPRPPPATDRSNRRASAFGSVRAMWPRRYELSGTFDLPHLPSSSVSEAEEGPLKIRRVTGDSLTSSASEASEPETAAELVETVDQPCTDAQHNQDTFPMDTTCTVPRASEDKHKSDPDSDSTIGAARDDAISPESSIPQAGESRAQRMSRLPRRPARHPSVAELVKKYQDYLPPQGIQDLTKTALAPRIVVSESDQEYTVPVVPRSVTRAKSRHRPLAKKPSTSDFEQSYAANIAPRYLTHTRRSLGQGFQGTRIPGPVYQESRDSSRRPSPEKRSVSGRGKELKLHRPSSPSNLKVLSPASLGLKSGRSRLLNRSKDKTPVRSAPSTGTKSTFRRPVGTPGGKVSNIAKHFERLGRDAERSKSRYNVIRGRRARPVGSARARVEVLDSVKDAINDESESSDSSSEADDEGDGNEEPSVAELINQTETPGDESPREIVALQTAPLASTAFPADSSDTSGKSLDDQTKHAPPGPISLPPSPFLSSAKMDHNMSLTPPQSDIEMGAGTERNSILKALSGFWLQPPPASRSAFEGDDPMSDPEHIFRDSSMVVRTDEPTSIIALALNSPQYREMLTKSRVEKRTAREPRLTDGEAFMPDDHSVAESTSTWGVVNVDASELADPTEDLKVPSSKLPWAISFESGGLTISCTMLYPEQFDALRRTYDCERSMVESLARCVKWDASGGKSGSAFLKTRDDRFIAKELSRPELQTMETFAPAYFDYMSSAVSADRPTLLAKVFGCYKLTFRKTNDKGPGKIKSTQMNLLVMENLFYDRRFSKIYDLKGSTRNRHVQSTGRENEVLLDENLVQTAHLTPFYLREHSKRILRGALYNDSKFLADINVMDYSLVCGVDSQNNELVVGIVDYIRTYTWDKKLESWVKESAFLGGAGRGEPTIVTPKQYRQRFIGAMDRYFPLIPDRWMKQNDTPEEDCNNSLVELWPDW